MEHPLDFAPRDLHKVLELSHLLGHELLCVVEEGGKFPVLIVDVILW